MTADIEALTSGSAAWTIMETLRDHSELGDAKKDELGNREINVDMR